MSSIQNALHILKKSAHMGSLELLWRPVLKAKKNKQGYRNILCTKYLVFDTFKDFFVIFSLRSEIPFMIVHNHFKRKYFHMHSKKTFEEL